jgi:polysaccharide biosynthesis protein PslJ
VTIVVDRPRLRPALVSQTWPFTLLLLLYPLWWILGVSAFVWAGAGIAMAIWLWNQPTVRMPPTAGIYLLFLGWVLLTVGEVQGIGRLITFILRYGDYFAGGAFLIWVFNQPKSRLSTERAIGYVAFFWIFVQIGGWLGLIFGDKQISSPLLSILPSNLTSDDYVRDILSVRYAQAQDFLGYTVTRPAAPFAFSNTWGSVFALLTPFVVAALVLNPRRSRKVLGIVLLGTGLLPLILSVNRGAWLSLGVGVTYVGVRSAMAGRTRPLVAVVVGLVVAIGIVALTPLGDLVGDRLEGSDSSNTTRASLYEEARERVNESPVLGYGTPLPSLNERTGPPVGSHGQFWLVLFSHGYPGAILFVAWLLALWKSTFRVDRLDHLWLHTVIVIALVQLPYYGMLPQVAFVATAAALIYRDREPELV